MGGSGLEPLGTKTPFYRDPRYLPVMYINYTGRYYRLAEYRIGAALGQ